MFKIKRRVGKPRGKKVILVIGSGGREHALAWKIAKSGSVWRVYCAKGNAGTAKTKKCINVDIEPSEIWKLLQFAKDNEVDLVVFGSEDTLAAGSADIFERNGIKVFGPSLLGAMMEASKIYAKELMQKYKIPTAAYRAFTDPEKAKEYIRRDIGMDGVVKADGLTGGKGVTVYSSLTQALCSINEMMIGKIYGKAGEKILIEKRLKGKETSYLFFTDGRNMIPCALLEDHKPLLDGDEGPNTGGMGIGPADITEEEESKMNAIAKKLVWAMRMEGIDYRGLCYIGFMICNGQPYVLEINCRFGDPETQPLMLKMRSDIVPILFACTNGTLNQYTIEWDERPVVCVVLAEDGYPVKPKDGQVVSGLKRVAHMKDVVVFYAGAVMDGKDVITKGGRNFGVVAFGRKRGDIASAAKRAYEAAGKIYYDGIYYRRDIPRILHRKAA